MPGVTVYLRKDYFNYIWEVSRKKGKSFSYILNEILREYFELKRKVREYEYIKAQETSTV